MIADVTLGIIIAANSMVSGVSIGVRLFITALHLSLFVTGVVADPTIAEHHYSDSQKGSDADPEDAQYNGQDLTRPQTRFETRFQYRTSSGASARTDRELMLLRADLKIDLDASWKLGLLSQIDLVNKTATSFDPNSSQHEFGAGDSIFQAVLSHNIDRNWAFGFGARLVAPTAEDTLGSGKWQIMPGFGVRYSFVEFGSDTYFVPALRYAISFAGDPSRRNISQAQIAPTLNIGLRDGWFLTLYPSYDIRINYGDPISGQTGRLFLPFDVALGRKVTESTVISLEASVPVIRDFPVYSFKTELRIFVRF